MKKWTNYQKGARKEQRLVNKAKNSGKIAFRSAGSHSPIDVCIIDLKAHRIEFFQCKPSSISANEILKLENELSGLGGTFYVSFKVLTDTSEYEP